jgi:hypothetical protein
MIHPSHIHPFAIQQPFSEVQLTLWRLDLDKKIAVINTKYGTRFRNISTMLYHKEAQNITKSIQDEVFFNTSYRAYIVVFILLLFLFPCFFGFQTSCIVGIIILPYFFYKIYRLCKEIWRFKVNKEEIVIKEKQQTVRILFNQIIAIYLKTVIAGGGKGMNNRYEVLSIYYADNGSRYENIEIDLRELKLDEENIAVIVNFFWSKNRY